jgi:hypothetical protein
LKNIFIKSRKEDNKEELVLYPLLNEEKRYSWGISQANELINRTLQVGFEVNVTELYFEYLMLADNSVKAQHLIDFERFKLLYYQRIEYLLKE